jgi:hypothetical protein
MTAMAKKRRPQKPAKKPKLLVRSPADWIPLAEACKRIQATTHHRELTQHELNRLVRGGDLPSAELRIKCGGTEVFRLLDPSEREQLLISVVGPDSGTVHVHGIKLGPDDFRVFYFVDRKKLDKFYPPSPGSPLGEPHANKALESAGNPRGPRSEKDWRKRAGREIALRAAPGTRPPTGADMCDWCGQTLNYEPNIGDMHKLISRLRFLFDE